MTDNNLYNWNDSHPYLGYIIVRQGEQYVIIDPEPNTAHLNYRYDHVEQAHRAVEVLYIEDLVMNFLAIAVDRGMITHQVKDDMSYFLAAEVCDRQFMNDPNPYKLLTVDSSN